jgi:Big-like domain-containing protein/IPT/TIG domain-containing protein
MPKYLAALAAALVVVACGGGDGSTTPKPATVSSVTMSQPTASMDVGSTLALTATPKDGSGNSLTGRATTWTSSNSNVASVSGGSVTALAVGTATITATIEGKTATTEISVHLAPVATVTVTPSPKTIIVGGVAQLTATLKDAHGNTLTGRTVTWSSSDETKVTVSATGVVTGVALGTVTITATSETKTGTATVTVSDGSFPIITSIAPDTIVPGVTVTITGTGFGANPQENAVTVAGTPVVVAAASTTQLSFVLPGNFPCRATQSVPVVVTTDLGSRTDQKPLKVAIQRSLAVGQSLMLTDVAALRCNELSQTGGRYLMSVYNTSTAPSATASFELQGNMATSVTPAIVATTQPVALRQASIGAPLSAARAAQIRARRDREAVAMHQHALMLENDRALVQRLGSPRRSASTARRGASTPSLSVSGTPTGTSSASLAPVPLTVGAMTSLKFRTTLNTCSAFKTVRARVVYVGTKNVVLEDSIAPLATTMDADLSDIGREFDDVMYPILTQNFGDPLAYDAQTDNNGRILMFFTPRVDSISAGGLQGFVSACDLFPPSADPLVAGSNQAEIFYARVPKNATQLTDFRRDMKGTVIHESKHITANAEKFASPLEAIPEESWLEEGTAQIATELYARTRPQYEGVTWKSNATYLQTVYCDVRPTFAGRCNGAQFLMADHMAELHDYYRANETKSYLSRASSDITIYGSAWKFARWATDQYGTSESAFLKSIVLETQLSGVANIEDKTHRPFAELSGWFTLALLADDYPGFTPPTDAKYTFPSWNIPDIFSGLAQDFPQSFFTAPLNTHFVTFGDFNVAVPAVAGGSGSLFTLYGTQSGAQAVGVRASGGGSPDPSTPLRIVFLRVQ